jgi:hypothetical protein
VRTSLEHVNTRLDIIYVFQKHSILVTNCGHRFCRLCHTTLGIHLSVPNNPGLCLAGICSTTKADYHDTGRSCIIPAESQNAICRSYRRWQKNDVSNNALLTRRARFNAKTFGGAPRWTNQANLQLFHSFFDSFGRLSTLSQSSHYL